MARINGTPTANLSVPQFSPKDDLNKSTFNELLRTLDTRINIVADETQALVEHEANTAGVHGIADTSDLVVTTDTPTSNEVLTYNGESVVWAPPAGGGIAVSWAGTSTDTSASNIITSWNSFTSTNDVTYANGVFTIAAGLYQVSFNVQLYNNQASATDVQVRFGTSPVGEGATVVCSVGNTAEPNGLMRISGVGVFNTAGDDYELNTDGFAKFTNGGAPHNMTILKLN